MSDPPAARKDRLLPWIAAERAFRAVVLLIIGVVLLSHPHTNWSAEITTLAEKLGLDPKQNWIQRILKDAGRIDARRSVVFGLIALAYAALEGVEAFGLWRRRRWAEWLTVLATSLLLIPEVWELTKSTTPLKVGALLVNIAVVLYLLARLDALPARLRRRPRGDPH